MVTLDSLLDIFGRWYCKKKCKKEYLNKKFKWVNERPIEYKFVFQALTKLYPKTVLDVGTGTTALPHLLSNCGFLVTAIDNIIDYWPRGMFNRHYYIIQDDITSSKLKIQFDFITCISVLEHIEKSDDAIINMFRLLKKNGYLVLTFPYNENKYIENVYKLSGAGYGKNVNYKCQIYSRNEINRWLEKINGKLILQEYWQVFTGKYWTFGNRLYPPIKVNKEEKHHLTCILLQKS